MKKIIAILMACIALTGCEVSTSSEDIDLALLGCMSIGAPLKSVHLVERWYTNYNTLYVSCGDGSVRLEKDILRNIPVVKEVPKHKESI